MITYNYVHLVNSNKIDGVFIPISFCVFINTVQYRNKRVILKNGNDKEHFFFHPLI